MSNVLVLNASNDVITEVHWNRAVTMVLAGKANIFKPAPNRYVSSQNIQIEFPEIIQLTRYVYIEHAHASETMHCNHKAILARDKYTCAYCGGYGDTVDHVFPESRGGLVTWDNAVASCFDCNNFKADRTPQEAGMKLLFQPYVPRKKDVYY